MDTQWLQGKVGMEAELPEEFLRSVENDHPEFQRL